MTTRPRQFLAYIITNTVDARVYIGITSTAIMRRWRAHLRKATQSTTPLSRAMNAYGTDAFKISVIASSRTWCDLREIERILIAQYESHVSLRGYNATFGGDGGDTFSGRKHSAATLEKMRIARLALPESVRKAWLGKKHSAAALEKMSLVQRGHASSPERNAKIAATLKASPNNSFLGRSHTDETKKKISLANTGRTVPQATRLAISVAHKGRQKSAATRAKMRAAWVLRRQNEACV